VERMQGEITSFDSIHLHAFHRHDIPWIIEMSGIWALISVSIVQTSPEGGRGFLSDRRCPMPQSCHRLICSGPAPLRYGHCTTLVRSGTAVGRGGTSTHSALSTRD
jgi:hypothetical protein